MNASWRTLPLTRMGASFVSWFLFVLCFGLLFQIIMVVMALGGTCASGGPFEIAVECPDNTWLAPVSIWVGLGAVALSYFLAQGFGTPLTTWAWPVLFVGLGGAFLTSYVLRQDIIGLVIGVLFVGMGFTPLVIQLRASPQRAVLGQFSAEGLQFVESDRARPGLMRRSAKKPDGAIIPTAAHWALSIGITTIAVLGGLLTAAAWV